MKFVLASTAVICVALFSPISMAQTGTSGDASFVASTKAKPGCPPVKIHILRSDTTLSGVVFFADGSGISAVRGSTDGKKFSDVMTSVNGQGPVGEVVGMISPNRMVTLNKVGTTCGLTGTIPMYTDVVDRGG